MNWFRRHLNWTLSITWLVCVPTATLCVNLLEYSIYENLSVTAPALIAGIFALVCVIMLWVVTIWVIKQKGRSLFQLFWCLLPLGFIAILILKNHNKKAAHSIA